MAAPTLGQILVSKGYITDEQLNAALQAQGGLLTPQGLGDLLVNMGYMTQRDKLVCLADQWGVPFLDLPNEEIDPEVAKSIGQEIARRYKALPLRLIDGKVLVAMKEPNDIYAIDALRLIMGKDVEPGLAEEEDILEAISEYHQNENSVADVVAKALDDLSLDNIHLAETPTEEDFSVDQMRELADEAPVVRLTNLIIAGAVRDGASDIHVEPGREQVRIRYRIDGILHDEMTLPKKVQSSLISRLKIMSDMDIAEKRAPQDGRISLIIDGKNYDFRVSTLPAIFGEKMVLRILDKSAINVGLQKLGMLPHTLEQFEDLIQRTYGILLVTGPTGSGKSTTLYSALSRLNSSEKNILTIEDPVEYELPGITQVGINNRAGITFASGLRTMLRQDPNIIMVGEIRDSETALIATEAALTGHLVLSTLHTNDAPGAIARMIDMDVEAFLIASSVAGVLAQRLVRVICPKCKESYSPPQDAVRRLGVNTDHGEGVRFYRGAGCESCKQSGYKGRSGIYELMTMTDPVRDLTLKRASSQAIRQVAIEEGMHTLKADAIEKVLMGITTLEESLRVIYSG